MTIDQKSIAMTAQPNQHIALNAMTEMDLTPLAWVFEELKKAIQSSTQSVKCFANEQHGNIEFDNKSAPIDFSHLHTAAQHLKQATGVLTVIQMPEVAKIAHSMACMVQQYMAQPATCIAHTLNRFEMAGFAALDYLNAVLQQQSIHPISLFPAYKCLCEALGQKMVHPADLCFSHERRLQSLASAWASQTQPNQPQTATDHATNHHDFEKNILRVVKFMQPGAAQSLKKVCVDLAQQAQSTRLGVFWWVVSAFFESIEHALVPNDVYVKRTTSKLLTVYAQTQQHQLETCPPWFDEILFFALDIAQPNAANTPLLWAIHQAANVPPVDGQPNYTIASLGLYDPSVLKQIQKHLSAAKEAWGLRVEGDASTAHALHQHCSAMADMLCGLWPQAQVLTDALMVAIGTNTENVPTPEVELGMEVATALLYLEGLLRNPQSSNDGAHASKLNLLAQRLQSVAAGQPSPALEPWMQALYRKLHDTQNLNSVVGELKIAMTALEGQLDRFIREPEQSAYLYEVPQLLLQMRGVVSVLGLEQAVQTIISIRSQVDDWLNPIHPAPVTPHALSRLTNNVSALALMIDMLAHQPMLAKRCFVFDSQQQTLQPVIGRIVQTPQFDPPPVPDLFASASAATTEASPAHDQAIELEWPSSLATTAEPEVATNTDFPELTFVVDVPNLCPQPDDLMSVFLEESRDVIDAGQKAIEILRIEPDHLLATTTLRRTFHTLKGSSRMVGLESFGQAAWCIEQVLNTWLAQCSPAQAALLDAAQQALSDFWRWTEDIATGIPSTWDVSHFAELANRMTPHAQPTDEAQAPEPEPDKAPTQPIDEVLSIGHLRIRQSLLNIFLNEAINWVDQLHQDLQAWGIASGASASSNLTRACHAAHALLGAASALGFDSLAHTAKLLETAIDASQSREHPAPLAQSTLLLQATDHIRHLLHEFAKGVLPPISVDIQQQLHDLIAQSAQHEVDAADDVGIMDALDVDLFGIFQEEAQDLLPQLGTVLRQWVKHPHQINDKEQALRLLHTLKGSARLAGAMRLGEMAHRMETHIDRIDWASQSPDARKPLLMGFDEMASRFEALCQPADTQVPHRVHMGIESIGQHPVQVSAQHPPQATTPSSNPIDQAVIHPISTQPLKALATQSIRVKADVLDRLTRQAGEIMMTRSNIDAGLHQMKSFVTDMNTHLHRLRAQMREIELQAEGQIQSRTEPLQEQNSHAHFDPLELDRYTHFQELTRMIAESVGDIATLHRSLTQAVQTTEISLQTQARQGKELQRDLLHTRMMAFESLSDRLYRVVRQAAKETGKHVKLEIQGGNIEIDRSVLERMMPAFEHLLRNCVSHGIETPQQRAEQQKPEDGHIRIALSHVKSEVFVSFSDDGSGLDFKKIRQKAIEKQLIATDQTTSHAELTSFIFTPGFSTATQITELSGRGIGMDVVRSEVQSLGGRIDVQSTPGQGTQFDMILPLTTAITQVVVMRVGDFTFGVPAHLIEEVKRVPPEVVVLAHAQRQFAQHGAWVPFYSAGSLLQAAHTPPSSSSTKAVSIVIFHSNQQRVALQVDELLGNHEVVIKHLGPQLSNLPGLTAMTFMASGAVLLIYNPVALAHAYGHDANHQQSNRTKPLFFGATNATLAASQSHLPLIMVVDDSITVRRVTQRLLLREGYRVVLASDGEQALALLRDGELPSVLLTDVEMPKMGGFDLIDHVRNDPRLTHLPIIVISSRAAEKHKEHAKKLGVHHYLGKPYSEHELVQSIKIYISDTQCAH